MRNASMDAASRCGGTRGTVRSAATGSTPADTSRPGDSPRRHRARFFVAHLIGRRADMTDVRDRFGTLLADEGGGEVIGYALVLGLIIVIAIAIIGSVGDKVLGRWTSVNSSL